MTDWSEPIHKEIKVKNYHLICYVSDPYYFVEVYKDGKILNTHLLNDDKLEFENLIKQYGKD
jgi:hypothetical protein